MRKLNRVSEMIASADSINEGFEDILELSKLCRFSNCTHTDELECAVKKAISEGILAEERFNTYYRLKKEAEYVSMQKNKTKAMDYMRKKKMFYRGSSTAK